MVTEIRSQKSHSARSIAQDATHTPKAAKASRGQAVDARQDTSSIESVRVTTGQAKPLGRKGIHATQLLVALEGGGAVAVNPKMGTKLQSYSTGPDAFGAIFSPDGKRAFITDKSAGTLSEIDPKTNKVLATINVGKNPQQPAIASDGRMFIPLSGDAAIAVVDTGNGLNVLRKIGVGEGSKPHIVSLSPDGKTLWATIQGKDPRVVSIAISPGVEAEPKSYSYDLVPRVVFATNDAAYFTAHHSTGLHKVNLADGAVSTPYMDTNGSFSEPRKQIEGIAVSGDGKLLGVTHEGKKELIILGYDKNGALRKKLTLGPLSDKPYWVTFDPSGKAAYVSIPGSGTVEAYDLTSKSKKPMWTANVGGKPKRMVVTDAK